MNQNQAVEITQQPVQEWTARLVLPGTDCKLIVIGENRNAVQRTVADLVATFGQEKAA